MPTWLNPATIVSILILIGLVVGVFLGPSFLFFRSLNKLLVGNPVFGLGAVILAVILILTSTILPWTLILTIPGVLIFVIKCYEWIDDRFLDDRIGGWITSQKLVFIKVIPSNNSRTKVVDMERFLFNIHSVYGGRTQKDMRTTGKYFEEFAIEIHATDNRVEMYIKLYKNSLIAFIGAAKTCFPSVQFIEVEDPLKTWPSDIRDLRKVYSVFDGGELSFVASEVYPTKNILEIQASSQEVNNNPILMLVGVLEEVQAEDYIVLQWVIRPMDTAGNGTIKKWEKEITAIKKDLATNSAVTIASTGQVNPFTKAEESIINGCERKMTALNFQTKFRFALFGGKITGKRYLPNIMAYLKLFATEKQVIVPKVKTWNDSPSATWGNFVDQLYWKPENEKMQRQTYQAFLERSLMGGGPVKYWDVYSLAAMLHVPNTTLEKVIISDTSHLLPNQAEVVDLNFNQSKTSYDINRLKEQFQNQKI